VLNKGNHQTVKTAMPVSVTCNGNVKKPKDVTDSRNGYCYRSRLLLFVICFLLSALFCIPLSLEAKVGGVCSNCHTMHNSQNGQAVARGDAPWGGSGGSTAARPRLLVSSCVGCHSSTGSSAIENFSGGKVPIVFNTGGYPSPALAGGNFYYVSLGGAANDAKGHNIFSDDVNLNAAPGPTPATCTTNNSCHANFHLPYTADLIDPDGLNLRNRYSCEGCHLRPKHHANDHNHLQGGKVTTSTQGWYRFLSGHLNGLGYPNGVEGYEDGDWQYTSSSNDHNEYWGIEENGTMGLSPTGLGHTMTGFCSGCHGIFRTQGGVNSPFTRHPADVDIPNTAEYTNAFGAGGSGQGTYDPLIPVARPVLPDAPDPIVYLGTDMVMCLSCHRAHGSQYYKMLRWDYKSSTLSGALSGCNVCHTAKN
jgi:predicted CXXCH cytochrome family protein